MTAMVAPPIESDEELQKLYNWIDDIPLSRPKRNISRDFSDGVLFAEIINHFFPRLIEMHNYSSQNNIEGKSYNWNTLNAKVLKKLSYSIHTTDIQEIVKASPGAIERVLKVLHEKVQLNHKGLLKVNRPTIGSRGGGGDYGGRPPMAPSQQEGLISRSRAVMAEKEEELSRAGGDLSSYGAGGQSVGAPPAVHKVQQAQHEVDTELLLEKEQTIAELREMVVIMSEKIKKLEQLVRIKDSKIEALTQKLTKSGLSA